MMTAGFDPGSSVLKAGSLRLDHQGSDKSSKYSEFHGRTWVETVVLVASLVYRDMSGLCVCVCVCVCARARVRVCVCACTFCMCLPLYNMNMLSCLCHVCVCLSVSIFMCTICVFIAVFY